MLSYFRNSTAFWKVPRFRPFVLITATCRWRRVCSIAGVIITRKPEVLKCPQKPKNPMSWIQGDSTGNVNILGGHSIGHYEKKNVRMNTPLIVNGYWGRAVLISTPNSVIFCLFVGLDDKRSLQEKDGYKRRITRSHFGCYCPHKETWKSTQTNNTRSSHCKVHRGWRWDFRILILKCNKSRRLNIKLKLK
jgi:hypothetical protein